MINFLSSKELSLQNFESLYTLLQRIPFWLIFYVKSSWGKNSVNQRNTDVKMSIIILC